MKAELSNLYSTSIKVIQFFIEDLDYTIDFSVSHASLWLQQVAQQHNFTIAALNYILCSDNYLLDINQRYLDHDYYTDIITFDNSDIPYTVEGDIFISIERVLENAHSLNLTFHEELFRVIVHGLLHLIGFDDKEPSLLGRMREMENKYLHLFFDSFDR